MCASATRATKVSVATIPNGPAFRFWLEVRRQTDRLSIGLRRLAELSGVSATSINRLKTAPHRSRADRIAIVRAVASAVNRASLEQFPNGPVPFPDDDQVLDLAGLHELEPDPAADVRETIRRSVDYDDQQKSALFGLLDVFDRERSRTRVDDAG